MRSAILLVDDSAAARAALKAVLGTRFDVVEAEGSASALRALSGRAFDGVVLDLEMPGDDGRKTWEFIASTFPFLAERTVVVSAGSLDASLDEWARGFGRRHVRKEDVFGVLDAVEQVTAAPFD